MLTVDFNLMPIGEGERVLDVGCGPGRHSWHVCKQDHCSLWAMDYDLESLQRNRYMLGEIERENGSGKRWSVLQGNAMSMPFGDDIFDKIICSEVLEHVLDDDQAVQELVRVLRPGGTLAVSVPAFLPESLYWKISEDYHTNPGGHIRIYRQKQVLELLKRHNLAVFAVRHRHAFHAPYWLLRCVFGVRNENARIPALYHKFLAWEMDGRSRFFKGLEGVLDHLFAKSLVVYVRKPSR